MFFIKSNLGENYKVQSILVLSCLSGLVFRGSISFSEEFQLFMSFYEI